MLRLNNARFDVKVLYNILQRLLFPNKYIGQIIYKPNPQSKSIVENLIYILFLHKDTLLVIILGII